MKPYFGMFTEAGNKEVAMIVKVAKDLDMTWPETYGLLCHLADNSEFGEATDTAVREAVYDALQFDTEFYI